MRAYPFFAFVLLPLSLAACPTSVDEPTGAAASSSSGSSSSGGVCEGPTPLCAPGCGGDAFNPATCNGGTWKCPPGEVFVDDCPPGSCFGLPLACETCPDGWACEPNLECVGSCDGVVCLECPSNPGPTMIGACECSCSASGEYSCKLSPSCCNTDMDCGDIAFVPCVEHVCKQPVPNGCWSDAECPVGTTCQGAFVCPCGFDCDAQDTPGMCL